jgi:EAL and modified HD-GYP domain-containing signal transduction protein
MTSDISDSILIARQPIFDSKLSIFAYELLFRGANPEESGVNNENENLATTRVIEHTFLEFGIEQIVGNHLAFINLTRPFLTGEIPLPFAPHGTVLEILENITVDQPLIDSVKSLVADGYVIALDDFVFSEEWKPLIKLASIIKIDIMDFTREALTEHVNLLKKLNVKLLAEKVETPDEFEFCKSLGFDYFQGYFFSKPVILNNRPIPNNKLSLLRLLSALQNPDIEIDEIENLVEQDVSLSFKLLKTLNSAAISLPRKIESLGEALIYLGLKNIKNWVTIVALSEMDSIPTEILVVSLVRAKMAESLAPSYHCNANTAFIVGMFSMLDVMLSKRMEEVLCPIQLGDDIKDALITRTGNLGELLSFIISYEQYFDTELPFHLNVNEVNSAYVDATHWVMNIQHQL